MTPISISSAEVVRFAVVLFRISGIMIFAPLFSSQSIPVQMRMMLTLVSALVMAPSLSMNAIPVDFGLSSLTSFFLGELFIGMALGFVATFVFAGMQFAGQIISFQLGFSVINLIDPQSQVEMPVFSFLQNYIGLLFFLLLNGHHWFFSAVNDSFSILPVGGVHIQASLVEHIIRLSSQIFVIGIKIAGPIIAVTVICDVVLGIIGRVAPQIPVFIIGMPLKILLGFGCISLSFYFLPRLLEQIFGSVYRTLFTLVSMMS